MHSDRRSGKEIIEDEGSQASQAVRLYRQAGRQVGWQPDSQAGSQAGKQASKQANHIRPYQMAKMFADHSMDGQMPETINILHRCLL